MNETPNHPSPAHWPAPTFETAAEAPASRRRPRRRARLAVAASTVVSALCFSTVSWSSAAAAATDDAADAPTMGASAEPVLKAPRDTTCYSTHEPGSASVLCERIATGVQVRVVADVEDYPDSASAWSSDTGIVHSAWTNYPIRSHRVEFRADPSGVGSDCSSWIVTTKERTLGYDEHAVRARCWSIAPAVKVRGGADYTAQTDVHTDWFTQPIVEFQSPGQTRTVPAMPVAFLEYGLVDY